MKKSAFLSFLFSFIFIAVQAQVEVGVFGIGQSTIITNKYYTEQIIKNKATFSSSVGAQLTYYTKSNFGFGLGLMYSAPNQKYDATDPITGNVLYSGKKRLDYMKVSALLQYRIVYDDRWSYFLYAGPQLAYLIKAAGAFEMYQTFPDNSYFYFNQINDINNKYLNTITMEVALGAGFEYKLNRNIGLQGGFRLDYGLSSIENRSLFYQNYYSKLQNNGVTYQNQTGPSKNIAFGITYGVIFHFGSTSLIAPSRKFGNKRRPTVHRRR
jgi:hypothetical protein